MLLEQKTKTLGRTLALWLGSFLTIGTILYCYGGVGIVPIALAGLATLAVTLFRFYRKKPSE